MEIKEDETQTQAAPMQHKTDLRDERKPTGLSVEILMTELCLLFDFRLLFTQCRLATKLDFLTILKMVYWYSLLQ